MYLPVPWYKVVEVVVSEDPDRLAHDRLLCLHVLLFIIEFPQEDEFQDDRPYLLELYLAQNIHSKINVCVLSGEIQICMCSEISMWGHESPTRADDFGKPLFAPQTSLVLSHY